MACIGNLQKSVQFSLVLAGGNVCLVKAALSAQPSSAEAEKASATESQEPQPSNSQRKALKFKDFLRISLGERCDTQHGRTEIYSAFGDKVGIYCELIY